MEALVGLGDRPEYGAWSLRAAEQNQPDLVGEVLVETAASAPLCERGMRPAFDAVPFFQSVLGRVNAAGQA
jgi:hypothetical protein